MTSTTDNCLGQDCPAWGQCHLVEARRRAQQRGADYRYYIFLDDDCRLREDVELARQLAMPLTGNPFRTFENGLPTDLPLPGHFSVGRFSPAGTPLPNDRKARTTPPASLVARTASAAIM